ncbi:RecQ family ATP-dependent DNA helicase [Immundisolibacter sp.]
MECPICGADMILRTARKGKNAGRQFYGCSQWKITGCKGIVDVDDSVQPDTNVTKDGSNEDSFEIEIPVFLVAREKFENYQVRFVESIALPSTVLEDIYLGKVERKAIKKFNQWRIDFPINSGNSFSDTEKQIFLIAHKILTRGRITQTSPFIEKAVEKLFNLDSTENQNEFDVDCLNTAIEKNDVSKYYLDGFGTEQKFYNNLLSQYLGDNFKKKVLPQVNLSSLIPDESSDVGNQRVDFLITVNDKKIIIELEGKEHRGHSEIDDLRQELLTDNGFEVFRIDNAEIHNGVGINLQRFIDSVTALNTNEKSNLSENSLFVHSIKIIHQIQITVLEAILGGYIDFEKNSKIYFDTDSLILDSNVVKEILRIATDDLKEMFTNLCLVYNIHIDVTSFEILSINAKNTNNIVITYNSGLVCNNTKFIIQDISFPFSIAQSDRPINYSILENPNETGLRYFLNYMFRHEDFLEGQLEAIVRTLNGKDSIVLLPTGAGKSIAFQLASMILPGVSIVVDPLISLIDDQLDNLRRVGIDRAVGITGQISNPKQKAKVIKTFGQGEYLFCYVAPERFQTQEFRDTIKSLTVSTPISVIVIDEAHCVSEWGHDFRTSYLNIGRIARDHCKFYDHIPPLLALTGTASNSVLRDVQRELQIDEFDSIITPKTFDRQELSFGVYESPSDQKFTILKGVLQRILPQNFNLSASTFYGIRNKETHSGIIFCPHRSGSFGARDNSILIKQQLGIETKFYSGEKPKQWNNSEDWNQYKRTAAKDFKVNKYPLLVATKSFGMGIDKPNIRYTIHYGLPFSIESFYQEAGRAGRDRRKAHCYILLSNDMISRTQEMLEPSQSIDDISEIMQNQRTWDNDDDITRAIYFHLLGFKGLSNELDDLKKIINSLDDLENTMKVSKVFKELNRGSSEKCIHRLLTLGVISDYTINYGNNEYTIKISGINKQGIVDTYCKYVSGYNRGRVRIEKQKISNHLDKSYHDFILEAAKVLIEFIYDTIEKGRRRALREVLALAESAKNKNSDEANQIIRERILKYLETSYSEELEEVLNEEGTFNALYKIVEGEVVTETGEIVGGIRSAKDILEIRGQTSRYLESYPDQPGLLFLRAITEFYSPESDKQIVTQNIIAGMNFSSSRYSIKKDIIYKTICWLLSLINAKDQETFEEIIVELLENLKDAEFARTIVNYPESEENMIYLPGKYLFSKYAENINLIIKD